MKEQIKTGVLVVVALLTLFNTYQIATMDTYGPAMSRVVAKKNISKADIVKIIQRLMLSTLTKKKNLIPLVLIKLKK